LYFKTNQPIPQTGLILNPHKQMRRNRPAGRYLTGARPRKGMLGAVLRGFGYSVALFFGYTSGKLSG
jgi:hypothetical protein